MSANKPYVVGLTGGIASGKTVACTHLRDLGAAVIDADIISRSLTRDDGEALSAIREQFGDEYFDENGHLNRKKLGALVFSSVQDRRRLEAILHPMVQRRTMEDLIRAGQDGVKLVILSVPLLYETGMDALCDETWVMWVPDAVQITRLMDRDGLDEGAARARIVAQMPTQEKLERATYAISNDRPLEKTRQELTGLYQQAKKRAEKFSE